MSTKIQQAMEHNAPALVTLVETDEAFRILRDEAAHCAGHNNAAHVYEVATKLVEAIDAIADTVLGGPKS